MKIIMVRKNTGCLLEAVEFDNGKTVSCWQTDVPEVAVYDNLEKFMSVRTLARGCSVESEIDVAELAALRAEVSQQKATIEEWQKADMRQREEITRLKNDVQSLFKLKNKSNARIAQLEGERAWIDKPDKHGDWWLCSFCDGHYIEPHIVHIFDFGRPERGLELESHDGITIERIVAEYYPKAKWQFIPIANCNNLKSGRLPES